MHGIAAGTKVRPEWRESVIALRRADPLLETIIEEEKGKPPRIAAVANPFEALVRSVLHQGVSAETGTARVDKLEQLFGGQFPRAAQILTVAFAKLHGIGVTKAQAETVVRLSTAVVERRLDLRGLRELPDEVVISELEKIKGIGRWSAQMFLVFHLKRPDVWMPGDVSLRRALKNVMGLDHLPSEPEMEAISEKWKPWRSAAAWYVWRKGGGFSPGLH